MFSLIKRYGIVGTFDITISWLKTKVFFTKSRLIRFPFSIRNRGKVDLGNGLTTGIFARIEAHGEGRITFGDHVQINDFVHISSAYSVIIEDDVLIASKVFISDHSHGKYNSDIDTSSPYQKASLRSLDGKPIIIRSNVWLGENVAVLPGVEIGANTVVGANSVVTKNLDQNSIYVGNPCRKIKQWDVGTESWVIV